MGDIICLFPFVYVQSNASVIMRSRGQLIKVAWDRSNNPWEEQSARFICKKDIERKQWLLLTVMRDECSQLQKP